jgi:hypothetical protein
MAKLNALYLSAFLALLPSAVMADVAVTHAQIGAVGDSLSTDLAISLSGASELNPLVSTSPAGLAVLAAAKLGLVEYADKLPPRQRLSAMQKMDTVWTGLTVNNLLITLGGGSVIGPVGGIVAGLIAYNRDTYSQAASLSKKKTVRPLPEGVRAKMGESVARVQLFEARRANKEGQYTELGDLELVTVAEGIEVANGQALYRPNGDKVFVTQSMGLLEVTAKAAAHLASVHPTVAPLNPIVAPRDKQQPNIFVEFGYAATRANPDGSYDPEAPEEEIALPHRLKSTEEKQVVEYNGDKFYIERWTRKLLRRPDGTNLAQGEKSTIYKSRDPRHQG